MMGRLLLRKMLLVLANCTVSPGVTVLGKGSILLPNSFLNKSTEPYSVNIGVPAKKIAAGYNYYDKYILMKFNKSSINSMSVPWIESDFAKEILKKKSLKKLRDQAIFFINNGYLILRNVL